MNKIVLSIMALCAISAVATAAPENKKVNCGSTITITALPETGYHFTDWSDGSTSITRTFEPNRDTAITANFAINTYVILFQNYDGAELQKDTVEHGAAVSYSGATPTKPATAQYTYTFLEWSPNIVSPATDNATYTAQFSEKINQYDIAFLNYDSTVLQSSKWNYGTTPSYSGATPTRPASSQYSYTFKGWDRTPSTVTGATQYVAQYDSVVNTYTITVQPNDANFGSTTGGGSFQYGEQKQISATPNACYKFKEWDDGNTDNPRTITVTETTTYIATFELIQYDVLIKSSDESKGKTKLDVQ